MQSFIAEVLGIVRAHVSALGGNAMVAFFMTQCVLLHNPHKNQVINIENGSRIILICMSVIISRVFRASVSLMWAGMLSNRFGAPKGNLPSEFFFNYWL